MALYGRVSTLDKGQDVNLQLNELREYAQRRGWSVVEEYVDNVYLAYGSRWLTLSFCTACFAVRLRRG